MTLAEITSYICEKIGKSDSVSQAVCKDFIRTRYRMIYDSQLWRDTLALYSATAASDQIILPYIASRVVAVRWDCAELGPVDQQTLFQIDPTIFDRTGSPLAFSLMTPIGTAILPIGGAITLVSDSAADTNPVLIRGELGGIPRSETVTLTGTTPVSAVNTYDIIYSVVTGTSSGNISLTEAGNGTLVSIPPDQDELKYLRIRLHQKPQDTTKTILVLYKRKMQQLTSDLDTPLIQGIDNALIAFGAADMLERQRQYAKAQIKVQEADALINVAIGMETSQAAAVARIIPWVGDTAEFIGDGLYDMTDLRLE